MNHPLFYKLWHDLWSDKARTLQVVLVIALGAIGIGLVIGGRNLIAATVAADWRRAEPPHIQLAVTPPLTDDQLRGLERIDGVAEAEGLLSAPIEWRRGPGDEWKTGLINSRDDYRVQKMSLWALLDGAWPARNTLAVGKGTDAATDIYPGDTVEIRAGEAARTYEITGTIKPVGPRPTIGDGLTVYADRSTFLRVTGRDTYNLVQTRDVVFDRARAGATDLAIRDYFEGLNVDSVGVLFPFQSRIVPPDVPPGTEILNAIFLILGFIGAVIVVLGVFLVYNSVSAIVGQQVNQIGVMKAIGATGWQVSWGYVALELTYGLLAALVSIPVGGLAARSLQQLFINFLNMTDPGFAVDPVAVAAQVGICLVAPLAAGLVPLRTGIAITVREAINTYGLGGAIGLVDRWVARLRRLPYTLLLVIGSAFRNTQRVLLIEFTLVIAGTIFMMVMAVNDATAYTFGDKLASIHNYQVTLALDGPHRTRQVQELVAAYPGVTASEMWLVEPGRARPAANPQGEVTDPRITLFGQPPESDLYRPEMRTGRWLRPDDAHAVVIHQRLAQATGWQVNDRITLTDANGRESDWQIVGVVYDPAINNSVYVPLAVAQRSFGLASQANTVWAQTGVTSAAGTKAIALGLAQEFERRGIGVAPSSTFGENTINGIVSETGQGFSIIVTLLAVMAFIIALVGGVGLSGVLSLSVRERRREIGVMRSIGASSWRVIRLFVGEGVLLGVLSWLVALPLSIPAGYWLATAGLSFALNQQLAYRFTPAGPLLWLAIIIGLAIVASLFPARQAAQLSVRESLAYS